MFKRQKEREATRSIFMNSIHGLANTGAVVATFFSAPILFNVTEPWVRKFTNYYYGEELADPASFVWFVLMTLIIFFSARASLSTLLVMGGLAIAVRYL